LEVSRITFSVHGLDETYIEITGSNKETFLKVIENLKLFKKEKENLKKIIPQIQVNIVINKKNYSQIPKMIEFANNVGVNILALHPMRGFEETEANVSPFSLSSNEIFELRKYIEEGSILSKKYGIMLDTSPFDAFLAVKEGKPPTQVEDGPLENLFKLRCFEPWYSMVVNPDGQVGRCTAFIQRDEPLNIRKMSLEEIWYGEYFNNVRKNVMNNVMMKGCSQCGLMSTTATLKRAFSMVNDWMKGKITFKELERVLDIGLKS
jgi:radical SAM protein with 4Fe4S-binding SPASM domain